MSPVDFRLAPERARATINGWVERQTRDRIKDVIPEGGVTPDTRLVLTNAIYFSGRWRESFSAAATERQPFALDSGATVPSVPLMRQVGEFRYFDAGEFQVLSLPYQGDAQSMVVVLPRRADGLPALEKSLTAGRMGEWIGRLTHHRVEVRLPRFTITARRELARPLSELGMPLPFRGRADFSGITTAERLQLSQVFHKAYVAVDEKGTEAAAATAGVMVPTSRSALPIAEFRADRPFFFAIVDHRREVVLFTGRVVDPRAG